MKRRSLVSFAAAIAALAALPARAQQPRVRRVGWLGANTSAAAGHLAAVFTARLKELGWVEGHNVHIDVRWAAGQTTKFREFAAELVAAGCEVIVTSGDAAGLAARDAGPTTPVVLASSADPVAAGLVQSLARPGGSVTGLTASRGDTAGKRLELLKDLVPGLRHAAVLSNPDSNRPEMAALRAEAPRLDVTLEVFEFRRVTDLDVVSSSLARAPIGALLVLSDPLVFTNRIAINEFALRQKMPTMQGLREYTQDGGLMSYGPDFVVMFRRAADFVDRILKGAKPADLPVEQPLKYELVINLKTAKALGITIPQSLLVRADELIQ
jgi:putative ABC transport system substrate-binding protein